MSSPASPWIVSSPSSPYKKSLSLAPLITSSPPAPNMVLANELPCSSSFPSLPAINLPEIKSTTVTAVSERTPDIAPPLKKSMACKIIPAGGQTTVNASAPKSNNRSVPIEARCSVATTTASSKPLTS